MNEWMNEKQKETVAIDMLLVFVSPRIEMNEEKENHFDRSALIDGFLNSARWFYPFVTIPYLSLRWRSGTDYKKRTLSSIHKVYLDVEKQVAYRPPSLRVPWR